MKDGINSCDIFPIIIKNTTESLMFNNGYNMKWLTSMKPIGALASSCMPLDAFSAAAREFSVSILWHTCWLSEILMIK